MMEDNGKRSSADSDTPDYAIKLITLITLVLLVLLVLLMIFHLTIGGARDVPSSQMSSSQKHTSVPLLGSGSNRTEL